MNHQNLERKLGFKFKNPQFLKTALTHRSYLNENPKSDTESNERLEFLGDAILEFLVTNHLFQNYPQASEGDLTSFRAATVSTKSLSQIARDLRLGDHLRLARGESKGGGKEKASILADSFEALLGAIYLDQGRAQAEKFLQKLVFPKIPEIISKGFYRDPKSSLQEKVQERSKSSPRYEVLEESGPDHQKIFRVGVFIADHLSGVGQGKSKQEAEEEAARKALEEYGKINPKIRSVKHVSKNQATKDR